jgi:hypothetical protein
MALRTQHKLAFRGCTCCDETLTLEGVEAQPA